jgi:hypothetical protein
MMDCLAAGRQQAPVRGRGEGHAHRGIEEEELRDAAQHHEHAGAQVDDAAEARARNISLLMPRAAGGARACRRRLRPRGGRGRTRCP